MKKSVLIPFVCLMIVLPVSVKAWGWAEQQQQLVNFDGYSIATNNTNTYINHTFSINNANGNIRVYERWVGGNDFTYTPVMNNASAMRSIAINASNETADDFWVMDQFLQKVYHLNASGSMVAAPTGNFTFAGNIEASAPRAMAQNASNRPPTDWWILTNNWKVFHLNSTGNMSRDSTGNCTLSGLADWTPAGMMLYPRNGTPRTIWVSTYNGYVIAEYNASTCAQIQSKNFYNRPANLGGLATNQSQGTINFLVLQWLGYADLFVENDSVSPVSVSNDTNSTWASAFEAIHFSLRARDAGMFSNATLATNISGLWSNLSVPYIQGNWTGNDSIVTLNFTYAITRGNSSKVVGWRFYFNDTAGNENATSIRTFTLIPYWLNSTQSDLFFNNWTAENRTHIAFYINQSIHSNLTFLMPLIYNNSQELCLYGSNMADILVQYNRSDWCEVWINSTNLESGLNFWLMQVVPLVAVPPSNLPAALAGATIATVVIIYLIVIKKKYTW